ncbi:hypothetical protein EA187_04615 [Lujinxingia sediminis]|uniref:DUF3618 domain-containing protein n=1 Tax=Lujinxingia sediminis TaxID=2480984 RepID=A0ABY0CXW3_9DELT|nr:hypothetical protein [Lujinxingia sediminis]RVU48717.1 hypothetical protein EA187_04615 [Lujinxingia sediminis]
MPNFQGPLQQLESELGGLSRELIRVEAHMRRGELRAARARLGGLRAQLELSSSNASTANQLAVIGAQVGLMSGGSDWLRGRLPAALICAAGGWLYGQSVLESRRRELRELRAHTEALATELENALSSTGDSPSNSAQG